MASRSPMRTCMPGPWSGPPSAAPVPAGSLSSSSGNWRVRWARRSSGGDRRDATAHSPVSRHLVVVDNEAVRTRVGNQGCNRRLLLPRQDGSPVALAIGRDVPRLEAGRHVEGAQRGIAHRHEGAHVDRLPCPDLLTEFLLARDQACLHLVLGVAGDNALGIAIAKFYRKHAWSR